MNQKTITATFSQQHSHCDSLFAQAEFEVDKNHWETATTGLTTFINSMECHFTNEEQILFPRFEQCTGSATAGPTQVMRFEHQQMRQLFQEMQASVVQQDRDQYLGLSETLLMLMRQHNAKEEQILYPMSDQMLADEVTTILESLDLTTFDKLSNL